MRYIGFNIYPEAGSVTVFIRRGDKARRYPKCTKSSAERLNRMIGDFESMYDGIHVCTLVCRVKGDTYE